jgi:hypothetical protein
VSNDYNKANKQPVILSGVELLPSEERGKSVSRKAMRDLVTIFGGLSRECNIYFRKPPKLYWRSLRRFGALVLYRIVACGSLPQQNFDFAQDDIQRFYLLYIF